MKPGQLDIECDQQLGDLFDTHLARVLPELNLEQMSPEAAHKLRGILKFYAKKKHPFAECVRDNTKRFGPDRAARICATIKDQIWGTTKWRGKANPVGEGPHPYTGMSLPPAVDLVGLDELDFDHDGYLIIEPEIGALIEQLSELDLHELLGIASQETA